MINDLTQGSVLKRLLKFSIPFMLANLLQTVYNLVDMIVIGQFVGSAGLSAVSNGGEMLHLLTFVGMGFSNAGQIIISQYVGRKEYKSIGQTIGTMFTLIQGASIIISILGVIFTETFITWLQVPEEAFSQACDYTRVCFAGTFFIYGYNTVSAALRGMGDSKRPLVFIAVAAVINLILDLVFVAGMGLESFGAALATVIGQAVSFIASIIYLYKRRVAFGFDFRAKSFIPEKRAVKALLKIGIPMCLQSSAISISMLVVSAFINSFGVVASAVTGVGNKIGSAASVVTNSLNVAGAGMVGQSYGAGLKDRVAKIIYNVAALALGFAVILSILMALFPEQIFRIFNNDPEVLEMAHEYVVIAILSFFGFATRAPALALVNGLGIATLNLVMGILDGIVMRIGLALLLGIVFDMGIHGFWYGSVIAGLMYGVIGTIYFFSGKWKNRKLVVAD